MSGKKENKKVKVNAELIEVSPVGEELHRSGFNFETAGQSVRLQKESAQIEDEKYSHRWVEPRYNFATLLRLMDHNVWHARSIYLKAALVCGLGWDLITDDENKEEDEAYKKIKHFLDNPNINPLETFDNIMLRARIDYEALGNCFLEVTRNLKRESVEIYHARALTMRRDAKLRNGYWQIIRGRTRQFRRWGSINDGSNEILHFDSYDPQDPYYGVPQWIASIADQAMDRSVVEYNLTLFKNQLVAKFMVLIEGGKLSPAGRKNLKEFLSQNFHGIQNAGRTIILDADDPGVKIKIEKLEVAFGDKEGFKQGIRASARDVVLGAHGIPPRLMGILEGGGLGGGSENTGQLKVFKETHVDPEQQRWEAMMNRTVIPSFGAHKWKLKFKEFDVSDPQVIAETLSSYVTNGVLDTNEAREEIGRQPREESESSPGLDALISLRKALELRTGV